MYAATSYTIALSCSDDVHTVLNMQTAATSWRHCIVRCWCRIRTDIGCRNAKKQFDQEFSATIVFAAGRTLDDSVLESAKRGKLAQFPQKQSNNDMYKVLQDALHAS